MSLVYGITFSSLPLSSTEGFFLLLEKEKKSAEGGGGGVDVCVFGGGDGRLAEWPFPLPRWLSCFCFPEWCRAYNKSDLPRPFLYSEIHNTTQHTVFIRLTALGAYYIFEP